MPGDSFRTEKRLRQLINQLVAFVAVLDRDGRIKDVDEAALAVAGLALDDVIGMHFWEAAWWNYDPFVQEQMRDDIARAAKGETIRREARPMKTDGSLLPVDFQLGRIVDEDGEVIEIIASASDITLQKQHEADLEEERNRLALLNRELRHRVKNLFAVVDAAISISARQIEDREEMIAAARSRIHALAAAHVASIEEEDFSVGFHTLLTRVLSAQSPSADALSIDGPSFQIGSHSVTPLTLVCHELATNATKYGAWAKDGGTIRVEWDLVERNADEDERENRHDVRIQWHEHIAEAEALEPFDEGFGSDLVRRCAKQLGGVPEYERADGGWRISMCFPAANLRE